MSVVLCVGCSLLHWLNVIDFYTIGTNDFFTFLYHRISKLLRYFWPISRSVQVSNQRIHTLLLKSQYYNIPALTCFGPHWSIIRETTILQKSCLIFSACSGHWGPKHFGTDVLYIVTLIELCAFVGSNFNNWIVMHGMENVKFQHHVMLQCNAVM
jgi:hypothetical protein